MSLCNQIIQFPQVLHNKTPVPDVGQDAKRSVQNQDGIPDSRCPNEHGAETLFRLQGRISLVRNRSHAQAAEKILREGSCLMPGHILVVLPDQGNIAPDGQVGDKGRLQGHKSQSRLVRHDETLQFLLQVLFVFEEV